MKIMIILKEIYRCGIKKRQLNHYIMSERLIIRKMTEEDIESLSEITYNENVYRYIPLFLYKKSRGSLLAAIRNLGGRDFDVSVIKFSEK